MNWSGWGAIYNLVEKFLELWLLTQFMYQMKRIYLFLLLRYNLLVDKLFVHNSISTSTFLILLKAVIFLGVRCCSPLQRLGGSGLSFKSFHRSPQPLNPLGASHSVKRIYIFEKELQVLRSTWPAVYTLSSLSIWDWYSICSYKFGILKLSLVFPQIIWLSFL